MARIFDGSNSIKGTFETTRILLTIDINFMNSDGTIDEFAIDLEISPDSEKALVDELRECDGQEALACLQRYVALGNAAAPRNHAPLLSPEQNATANRLLRDALRGMDNDSGEEADPAV